MSTNIETDRKRRATLVASCKAGRPECSSPRTPRPGSRTWGRGEFGGTARPLVQPLIICHLPYSRLAADSPAGAGRWWRARWWPERSAAPCNGLFHLKYTGSVRRRFSEQTHIRWPSYQRAIASCGPTTAAVLRWVRIQQVCNLPV